MPYYLLQVSYTPEAWSALMKNPHDRQAALSGTLAKLGGKMEHAWFAFGESDIVAILNLPNQVSAAALAAAIAGGGACKSVKTTPLLTMEEGIEALKLGASCGYKPATAAAARSK